MGGKSPTPKYSRAHIDPAPCVPTGAVVPLDMGRTRSVVFHTTPRAQYLNVSNPRIGCTSRSRLPPTAWLHGSQRRWWEGQQPSTQQYRSQRRAPGRALRGRSSLDENRCPLIAPTKTPHPHNSRQQPCFSPSIRRLRHPSLFTPLQLPPKLAATVLPPPLHPFPRPVCCSLLS